MFWFISVNPKKAILASAFARKDYPKATATASRILQVCYIS